MRHNLLTTVAVALFSVSALALAAHAAETGYKFAASGTKSHHIMHPKRSTVQPASAPAAAVPEFQPTKNPSAYQMEMQYGTGVRPPEHIGEKSQ
jgi:hypothetical protein